MVNEVHNQDHPADGGRRRDPVPPRPGRRMIGPSFEGRPLRVGHVFVLLLSLGVLIATLFGFIAHHSGPQHIPADPGTPASVTTIGVPR